MQKITDIYVKYSIPKNLQEHMECVACVAYYITEHTTIQVDTKLIVGGALTHDLGNILKFDLELHRKIFTLSEETFLEIVNNKELFKSMYGSNCEAMTIDILKKEGFEQKYIDIVTDINFTDIPKICTKDLEKQILKYADLRVGLLGVITLQERLDDAEVRYPDIINETNLQALYQMEKNIFSHCKIKPEDITEESIAPYMEKLTNFTL